MLDQLGTVAREFLGLMFRFLPGALAREAVAWIATFVVLSLMFRRLKRRLKPGLVRVDDKVRAWAKTLRYRAEHPGVSAERASVVARQEVLVSDADNLQTHPEADVSVEQIEALEEEQAVERVPLTWFFRFWTNFASAPSLSLFSLAVPLWAYHRARSSDATVESAWQSTLPWLLPGLCYAGSMMMSWVLKRVFKRLRPQRRAGDFGHKLKDGSFPSGHSLTSFCFWMAAATVAFWTGVSAPIAAFVALIAVSIVALTGLSRVYLGVHFPTDVLGGYTIGITWCIACFWTLRPLLTADQLGRP